MKEALGYLLMIVLITIFWSASYMFYTRGDITGTYIAFSFGAFLVLLFIFCIHYYIKIRRRNEFVSQDFETVMTHFHYVEKIGDFYIVHTIWIDSEGDQYMFKSDMIKYNPEIVLKDKLVPVKISLLNRNYYTMDLSSLPKLA